MKKRGNIYKKLSIILAGSIIASNIPVQIYAQNNTQSEVVEQKSDKLISTDGIGKIIKKSGAYIQDYDRPEGITWTNIKGNGSVDAADGFLSITNNGDYRFIENESQEIENGELEVRFQLSKENAGQFGVLFRANAKEHAGVAYDTNGKWVVHNGSGKYKQFDGPKLQSEDWVTLKVIFVGDKINVNINGENYFDEVLDFLPVQSGKVGYRSWFANKTNKVDYIKYGLLGSLDDGQTPEIQIESIQDINISTFKKMKPELPSKIKVSYSNGATGNENVTWDYIEPSKYAQAGNFRVEGSLAGTDLKAIANVEVRDSGVIYEPNYIIEENQGWKTTISQGNISYNGNSIVVGMNGKSLAFDEKSPKLKDFIYETNFTTSTDDGRIGLVFRYVSDTQWGAICYDNGSWIWKNGASQYGSFGGSSVKIEKNKTYKLKLKVQDNNATLYVNDELIGSQSISNLPAQEGHIGLHGWFGNKNVTLSDIKVEEVLPLLPPEVGETEEQVIESKMMKVVLDNNFPRVLRYEWKEDGSTLIGEDEQLYIMEINGEKYVPNVSCKTSNNETTYNLEVEELGVTITIKMTLDNNKLRMEVIDIKESTTKVKTINFPNHSLASVQSNQNGKVASVLTTGDWNNIIEEFKDVKSLDASTQGKTYAFINNDDFAITINNNVIEGGNRVVLSTENRDGYKKTGIGNGTWTYREVLEMPDGYKSEEELPWSEVMITKDCNDDNIVDWQDAAIQYRKNMKISKGGEDIKNNLSYIAMNIGYTQNPFLRSLDMVKKISNYTDNFGQLVLHKGYQAEGHDDSHPDYGGHIGIRQGGVKDFNTLINEGKKYNASIGVHINATEYARDAFEYPTNGSVNENAPGWAWMDKTFYVDQRKDITSGELYRRLDMLKEDAPDLGWVYVDVYTGNGWNANKLAKKVHELDYMLATEMNGPLEQDAVWTHWGGDPAYPNKGNASTIMRFIKNDTQDSFLANPLLKGNKHLLSGGWGDRHDVEGEFGIRVFYNQVLPTKYLQHFPIIKMSDKEVLFENGVKSVDEGKDIKYYRNDRVVATTPKDSIGETGIGKTQLFLPWNPIEEDEKIYHWNPLGTKSEWELPDGWKNLSNIKLYELSDLGKTFVKDIKVKNGKVTLDVKQDTPYIVTKGKIKEERIDDWGFGSEIKDPGFDSQTWKSWKKKSDAKNTDHIQIVNEEVERRKGNDIVKIQGNNGANAKISQKIKGLEEGATYSISAWVKNDDKREITLGIDCKDEKVETKIKDVSKKRAGQAVKFRGDTFSRIEVEFTVPKGSKNNAQAYIETAKGSENSAVYVDDFRIWKHPGHTNKDGYVLYEDFENVDEGIGPFYLEENRGNSNRTHLAEKSLDPNKQQRMNWVLDGRFSLKSNQKVEEVGEMIVTEEASIKLDKNKTYELGFIYSLADKKPGYTFNIKSKSQGTLLSIELDKTDVASGEFTNAKKVIKEFKTGNVDDYYLSIDKNNKIDGKPVELILDNLYIKELKKDIKDPKLQYVNLNTMINNLEVGKSIDIFANALMNNGETVNLKDAKVEYISSNKKVATVENGKLIAKSKGSTKISLKVTVDKKTVTSNEITINVSNK